LENPEFALGSDPEDPCNWIVVATREIHGHIVVRVQMLEAIGNLVGCSSRSCLVGAVVKALINSNRIGELEEAERRLKAEKQSLENEIREQETNERGS
jgi:hypothetical protein